MAASQSTLPPNSLLKQYDVYDVRQCGLPMFDGSRDLRKISKLGQGCSSNVYLVATESRKQLALKCLDPRAIEDQDHFDSLAGDIFREAHTLTSLDHNNIIKIRGVSTRQPSESFANDVGASWENGVGFGYFFLMDDLEETLMDRMKRWSKDKGSFSPKGCRTLSKLLKKKRKVDLVKMIERIETAAMGVAQGMEYLHGKNIIMQDLKPENVGFDMQTGRVCLFDMGMARHMNELSNDNVVEICGTPRYTAPELFQGKTPGTASDVYSFGCVLYTICSLEVPFQESNSSTKTNLQDFQTKIVAGERPALDHIPSHDVRKLISECWAHNPADRPSFQDIAHDRLPAITRPDTHSLKPSMNPPDSLTWNTSFTSSFRSESGLISDVSGLATPTHCKPSPNEKNLLAHEPLFRGSNFEARISIAKQRCKIM